MARNASAALPTLEYLMQTAAQTESRQSMIDRLKRLLTEQSYASLEELEEAVDTLMFQEPVDAQVMDLPAAGASI
jgi:hypothetical protein